MRKRLFFLLSALIIAFSVFAKAPFKSVGTQQVHEYYFPFFPQQNSFKKFSSVGPDGGTISSIKIDPTNSDVVYASTWGHGIYKSVNGGRDWIHYSEGFRAGFVFDLAIDPENHQHLLASAYRFGAYESFDGGRTWQKTTGMPDETVVYSFAFHPENSDIVYAAVRLETIYNPSPHYPGAVYKSTNGGSQWIKQDNGLPDDYVYDVVIDPNNPEILYTAMHVTGVYKSVNGGVNWFSVNSNIHYRDVRSIDINPHNSTIYAGMYDGKGVAYSTNGGASWSTINHSVTQRLYVYKLQLDPNNFKSLYLSTPDGLYRCHDNLYPSSQTGCERIAHDDRFVFALALDKNSASSTGAIQTIYTGLRTYGLHKSTNGGQSFSASYSGLKSNVVLSVLNDPESQGILYASVLGRGVLKSFDSGQNWQAITNGMSSLNINHLAFSPGNSQVIYAATQSDGIFITTDGGNNWSATNTGIAQIKSAVLDSVEQDETANFSHPSFSWMDPADIDAMELSIVEEKSGGLQAGYPEILTIQISPDEPSQMIAGTAGKGVLKSNDYGHTWHTTELTWGDVYDSIVDLNQPVFKFQIGVIDAGIRGSDLNRTSWPTRNIGFHSNADVYGLSVSISGIYFAATDQGIYRTTNGGGTWSHVGLSNVRFNDVHINPNRTNEVWGASSDGLYHSVDGGANWELVGDKNLNDQFLTIAQGYGTYEIYFGMSGGNIFRIEY